MGLCQNRSDAGLAALTRRENAKINEAVTSVLIDDLAKTLMDEIWNEFARDLWWWEHGESAKQQRGYW